MTMTKTSATIWLNTFKQGDDMYQCRELRENGSVDVKKTLENYIDRMNGVVKHVEMINENIPEENDLKINADTHYIGISGDANIIKKLVNLELVQEDLCYDCNEPMENCKCDEDSECGTMVSDEVNDETNENSPWNDIGDEQSVCSIKSNLTEEEQYEKRQTKPIDSATEDMCQ